MGRTRFSIAGLMGFVLIVAVGIAGLKGANPLWASACFSVSFVGLVAGVLLAIQARGLRRAFWVGFAVAGCPYFLFAFFFPTQQDYAERPRFLTAVLLQKAEELFFPDASDFISFALPAPLPVPPPVLAPTQVPVVSPPPSATAPLSVAPTANTSLAPAVTPAPAPFPVPVPPASLVRAVNGTLSGTITTSASPVFLRTVFAPRSPFDPQVSFHHVGQAMATLLLAYAGGLFSLFLAGRRERNEANDVAEVSPSSP